MVLLHVLPVIDLHTHKYIYTHHTHIHTHKGFRLTTGKAVLELEKWRKLRHANLVTLQEMFTTKAFGDNCKQHTKLL